MGSFWLKGAKLVQRTKELLHAGTNRVSVQLRLLQTRLFNQQCQNTAVHAALCWITHIVRHRTGIGRSNLALIKKMCSIDGNKPVGSTAALRICSGFSRRWVRLSRAAILSSLSVGWQESSTSWMQQPNGKENTWSSPTDSVSKTDQPTHY